MKKKWETPRMYIEEFAPNEYVSVCLYLECAIPGDSPYECYDGQIPKRIFNFDIGSWGGIEISPDGQEHYRCGLRTTSTYDAERNKGFWWTDGKIDRSVTVSDVHINSKDGRNYVTWKTTDQNGVVYQHYGYGYVAETTLPNRS